MPAKQGLWERQRIEPEAENLSSMPVGSGKKAGSIRRTDVKSVYGFVPGDESKRIRVRNLPGDGNIRVEAGRELNALMLIRGCA